MEEITETVKKYILEEFLPGQDPDELKTSTPLIKGGILDSIAVIKLVAFLEEKYSVAFEPHEIDVKQLGTISDIVSLISAKTRERGAYDTSSTPG